MRAEDQAHRVADGLPSTRLREVVLRKTVGHRQHLAQRRPRSRPAHLRNAVRQEFGERRVNARDLALGDRDPDECRDDALGHRLDVPHGVGRRPVVVLLDHGPISHQDDQRGQLVMGGICTQKVLDLREQRRAVDRGVDWGRHSDKFRHSSALARVESLPRVAGRTAEKRSTSRGASGGAGAASLRTTEPPRQR